MDDKERALKDMQESMEFAVRRKQQIHEAVPIVNGGASTMDSGSLTDLQLTKLCAEAMGVKVSFWHPKFEEDEFRQHYWPLSSDAQAMALVKRFRIRLLPSQETNAWMAWLSDDTHTVGPDVNSAIVSCIAQLQLDRTARETSTVAQDK